MRRILPREPVTVRRTRATLTIVTADSAPPGPTADKHPLAPGASPAAVRSHLLVADRARFDAAYDAALRVARENLDLTALHATVEHWRRMALMQQDGPDFRRVVRRTAELRTGQPVPPDEPLEITRAKAGI